MVIGVIELYHERLVDFVDRGVYVGVISPGIRNIVLGFRV